MASFDCQLADCHAARSLLETFGRGLHPETHLPLPKDHIAREGDVIRALYLACTVLRAHEEELAWSLGENPWDLTMLSQKPLRRAGMSWTRSEDDELRDEFRTGVSTKVIARDHERSRGAIASRLSQLGLIPQSSARRELNGRKVRSRKAPSKAKYDGQNRYA